MANTIENPLRKRCCDGGALYTLGPQPNSVIERNHIVNHGPNVSAITNPGGERPNALYHDNGSGGFLDRNNVIEGEFAHYCALGLARGAFGCGNKCPGVGGEQEDCVTLPTGQRVCCMVDFVANYLHMPNSSNQGCGGGYSRKHYNRGKWIGGNESGDIFIGVGQPLTPAAAAIAAAAGPRLRTHWSMLRGDNGSSTIMAKSDDTNARLLHLQCGNMTILRGVGLAGDRRWAANLTKGVASQQACCALCLADKSRGCTAYTYHPAGGHSALDCYLIHALAPLTPHPSADAISGTSLPVHQPPSPLPAPAGDKNLLVFIADDFRPAANYSYGMTEIATPSIDELAQSGMTFTNAYSQFQWCSPSRNSFMSGRRPNTIRVWSGANNFRDAKACVKTNGEPCTSWPEHFKNNGWLTAGTGKTCEALIVWIPCL